MRLLLALRKEKNESENKNKTKISGLGRGAERGQSSHAGTPWCQGMLPIEFAAAQGWEQAV